MFTASVPFPEQEEAAEEEAEEGEAAGEAAGEADGEVEAEDTNAEGKALGKYPPPRSSAGAASCTSRLRQDSAADYPIDPERLLRQAESGPRACV